MDITHETRALVTGANGGIGAAIARALRKAGAQVWLHARREDAVRPLADELGAKVVLADLADRAQLDRMHAEVGDVDVLVANAAVSASGPVLTMRDDDLDRALEVNLRAQVWSARHFARGMAERRRGSVVFISSVSGLVGAANSALYSATKFGLRGFALGFRADLAPYEVGVTTVFPGFIRDAGMFVKSGAKLPSGVGTRTPDDVARAVLRAVRENPTELVVASPEQRLAGVLGGLAPGLLGWLEQRAGFANKLGAEIAAGQRARAEAERTGRGGG